MEQSENRKNNRNNLSKVELKQRARDLVSQMTLFEKASLCSGKDCWTTKPIERLGLESVMVADGPHGLRKQIGKTDNLGIGDSIPSVCFPTASAMACSFDRELLFRIGKAMGEECLLEEVAVILGPGVNQKRSPLCGRNFEYYSEDPVVSGELASSLIQGVQSTGVGTSLKHFAVNNQEKRRMTIDALTDERALRETYLKSFEIAVKKGKPDTVMCSYNRLNGEYCSEHDELLNQILRNEWGFEGLVVSDWGAVHDRVLGLANGLELEMPGNDGYRDLKIEKAVKEGKLSEEILNQAACKITEMILKGMKQKEVRHECNMQEHHNLAIEAALQSAVLLKNQDNILPGNRTQRVAVIGALAAIPRYQGAGSSKIHPIKVENGKDSLEQLGLKFDYCEGYSIKANRKKMIEKDKQQEMRIKEACEIAKDKDIVYLFAGLTEGYESEGFDREDMGMPLDQIDLIEAVCECNANVVVILEGGAPMEMPWVHKVKAILAVYLAGEGGGMAVAKLLLGDEIPCGKLAETWPLRGEDVPSYLYFPGELRTVEYRESIYVGYKYYEKAKKPVAFPFGAGLSYTEFEYKNLTIDKDSCRFGETVELSFEIKNVGTRKAKETAFIFSSLENKTVFMPVKELREFVKVELEPGETKKISISLDTRTFGYYNTLIRDWYSEEGVCQIIVGNSVDICPLSIPLFLSSDSKPQPDYRQSAPCYYHLKNASMVVSVQEFEAIYGKVLPDGSLPFIKPYTQENTLEDIKHTVIGKLIIRYSESLAKKVTDDQADQEGMMAAMMKEMPFYAMVATGEGMISEAMMEGVLEMLNGHFLRGVKRFFKK